MMGKDVKKLQDLITSLEKTKTEEDKKKQQNNTTTNNVNDVNDVNETNTSSNTVIQNVNLSNE